MKATKKIDDLLRAHIRAWHRSIKESNFVELVNATYADFTAAGGSDNYCKKHWDRVKRRMHL